MSCCEHKAVTSLKLVENDFASYRDNGAVDGDDELDLTLFHCNDNKSALDGSSLNTGSFELGGDSEAFDPKKVADIWLTFHMAEERLASTFEDCVKLYRSMPNLRDDNPPEFSSDSLVDELFDSILEHSESAFIPDETLATTSHDEHSSSSAQRYGYEEVADRFSKDCIDIKMQSNERHHDSKNSEVPIMTFQLPKELLLDCGPTSLPVGSASISESLVTCSFASENTTCAASPFSFGSTGSGPRLNFEKDDGVESPWLPPKTDPNSSALRLQLQVDQACRMAEWMQISVDNLLDARKKSSKFTSPGPNEMPLHHPETSQLSVLATPPTVQRSNTCKSTCDELKKLPSAELKDLLWRDKAQIRLRLLLKRIVSQFYIAMCSVIPYECFAIWIKLQKLVSRCSSFCRIDEVITHGLFLLMVTVVAANSIVRWTSLNSQLRPLYADAAEDEMFCHSATLNQNGAFTFERYNEKWDSNDIILH